MAELTPPTRGSGGRTLWKLGLLALGAGLLVWLVAANDAGAILAVLLQARFAILLVVAAHLLVTFAAGDGWRVLLPAVRRPSLWEGFRLRLIKEAVNSLLPVAQVGGDLVRARLAVSERLSLPASAAACLVDVFVSLGCLALFILAGLAAASVLLADPRGNHLALQLAVAAGVVTLVVAGAERFGVLRLIDRAAQRSQGVLGRLSGLGAEVAAIRARPWSLAGCSALHLASWGFGVLETWLALFAVNLPATLDHAFVLESLAQGARALGFAVPGALGVQEGGYVLICAMLGIGPETAVALALMRRIRELTLGVAGLGLWRFRTPPLPPQTVA